MQEIYYDLFKFFLAIVFGGLIGLERELKGKPAGFRTNILICLGSTLYMILSMKIAGDPGRIAAQVVTGIGFIGAGTIIQARGTITGLTTAATIFVVASIGLAIGSNQIILATIFTGLVLIVLTLLSTFEKTLLGKCHFQFLEIEILDEKGKGRAELIEILNEHEIKPNQYQLIEENGNLRISISYCDKHPSHHRFLSELLKIPYIKEIKTKT
ncbi:putative Mg2+ transporter-C (MgtC) family protein [Candidatus Kryptonium thompsonii]|uniref:Mg2+ transporter-C (MgtC) family protein n=2 Tax=Candidatus Kryptonium thompsonii TaxID=1633631 RepID=A0A0P1P7H9_9BACT|nr:MgtC/SapB family protein [Candidatus Kryptonium thompsoni]CUS78872.1 putative Mg2+ transporter-C (MgtC) family protein [Candidatus Kryptonium thompsoni]CUS81240.1 putative Mg2+ transporter-C (MgtC) family protein [Candidatus Kryptonium thompsoni]CUS85480.1 putative Mg2+ transporter-C (MgtC) family protein [Candidatus Kryptonium thompsoni]CUS85551.1 putative Mg2+ transporter-C (MgtC) family protein [Candidatus Kryptonium thompsoni]CUS93820.1 putative Mg2+ transporter-C (MgtC) family protein 